MERELLLLGLLRQQDMHGYQLHDVLNEHQLIQLKKSTAYDLLRKMTQKGWITAQEEQEGGRPPRRVYALTAEGEQVFQELLRQELAAYHPAEFASDVSVAFLEALPAGEAAALLRQRRTLIVELHSTLVAYDPHPGSMQFVIDHQIRHLKTELAWLDDVIAQLESEGMKS